MTDEERTEAQEEADASEETTAPDFAHFGVVLERKVHRFHIPTLPHKYYVDLRAPDAKGAAEIEAAQYEFSPQGVTIDAEGNAVGAEFAGRIDAWGHFLAKCYAQIVDYCLPQVNDAGEVVGETRYRRAADGRNSHNRQVYESLSPALMNYLTGAMDWVAGDTSDAREAFKALLSSSPSLVGE